MNEKQYLISESELNKLINTVSKDIASNGEPQYDYKAYFLSPKPEAKTLDREEVEKIIRKKFGLTWTKPDGTVLQMIPEISFQEAITAICNLAISDIDNDNDNDNDNDKLWDWWGRVNNLAYRYHDLKELNSGQYSFERSKLLEELLIYIKERKE